MLNHLTRDDLLNLIALSANKLESIQRLKTKHGIGEKIDFFDPKRIDYDTERRLMGDAVKNYLASLSDEAIYELEAIAWIGRGDADFSSFDEAVTYAKNNSDAGDREYISGKPLHIYLAAGMEKLSI